jgi:hypothetical protein
LRRTESLEELGDPAFRYCDRHHSDRGSRDVDSRAMAVAMMLLSESVVDPQKMSIAGYAQYHPSASNDTAEGRKANRRVDIVVVSAAVPTSAKAQLEPR